MFMKTAIPFIDISEKKKYWYGNGIRFLLWISFAASQEFQPILLGHIRSGQHLVYDNPIFGGCQADGGRRDEWSGTAEGWFS
jgi:hypothetical protein